MARGVLTANSWLDRVASLLKKGSKHCRPKINRRLSAERLEGRTVLSTTSTLDPHLEAGSLAEYLADEHQMGPSLPGGEVWLSLSASVAGGTGEGEGDGGGSASGSGSGGGTASGSGSGAGSASGSASGNGSGSASGSGSGTNAGSGSGYGQASGSGSGFGEGEGSGSGNGSGSGSGSGNSSGSSDSSGSPTVDINDTTTDENGVTVLGTIADDGGMDDLVVTLSDGSGSLTVNDDGTFSLLLTNPNDGDIYTITVTDANGNSTDYSFTYHT